MLIGMMMREALILCCGACCCGNCVWVTCPGGASSRLPNGEPHSVPHTPPVKMNAGSLRGGWCGGTGLCGAECGVWRLRYSASRYRFSPSLLRLHLLRGFSASLLSSLMLMLGM